MASNKINIDWERGRSPAALMAKLEGFEAAFFDVELPKAAKAIALRLERDAKKGAPVDTGTLKADISSLAEKIADHTVRVLVGNSVEYAPFQEMGTVHMSAQPYIRPAIEKNREWIKDRVKEAFENAAAIVS